MTATDTPATKQPEHDPNNTDVQIVSMTVSDQIEDIGKEAAMKLPPGRRRRYSRKVVYHLADGRQDHSEIGGATKPKLAELVKIMQENVQRKRVKALVRNGEVMGYSTVYGVAELVP